MTLGKRVSRTRGLDLWAYFVKHEEGTARQIADYVGGIEAGDIAPWLHTAEEMGLIYKARLQTKEERLRVHSRRAVVWRRQPTPFLCASIDTEQERQRLNGPNTRGPRKSGGKTVSLKPPKGLELLAREQRDGFDGSSGLHPLLGWAAAGRRVQGAGEEEEHERTAETADR